MTGLTKKWDAANEFISLMSKHEQSETIRLVEEVNATINKLIELNHNGSGQLFERKELTVLYRIDKSECSEMDKDFKKEFIRCPNVRLTKRKLNHFDYAYEIRYRSNKYTLTAIADSLDEAKQKFLEMTKTENIKRSVSVLSHGKEVDKVL